VVVHNFHSQRSFALPTEADPPLVVHPNAVLVFAIAFQGLNNVKRYEQSGND